VETAGQVHDPMISRSERLLTDLGAIRESRAPARMTVALVASVREKKKRRKRKNVSAAKKSQPVVNRREPMLCNERFNAATKGDNERLKRAKQYGSTRD